MRVITAGILVAAALLFAVPAIAAMGTDDCASCPMGPGRGEGFGAHCPRMGMAMGNSPAALILAMQDKLKLDDKQVQKLQQMDTDFRTKQIDRRATIEKKMIQVHQALSKDATAQEVKPMIDDISKDYADAVVAWIDAKQKAMEVLNEDQRTMVRQAYGMQHGPMRSRSNG